MTHTHESERRKYRLIWDRLEYRRWSPGEDCADRAIESFRFCGADQNPQARRNLVYDFGCGEGKSVDRFRRAGFRAAGFDLVPLHPDIIEACLWNMPEKMKRADFGFSADVLEHIPPERVDLVIATFARLTKRRIFLRIATTPDAMGALIGETLHLTVKSCEWWESAVAGHFRLARVSPHESYCEIVADAHPARRDA